MNSLLRAASSMPGRFGSDHYPLLTILEF